MFNKKSWKKEELIGLVKIRMAMWIEGKYNIKSYTVDDFIRSLDGI